MKHIFLALFLGVILPIVCNAQEDRLQKHELDSLNIDTYDLDKLRASIYLNECAYSLTKILKSGNKFILLDEQYKLNNTYRWENITDYPAVVSFRKNLQIQLNNLIINEINRDRFKKEFERKKNAAARNALLGAISGVQVNVNIVSIVSNILISSARAYLDYGKQKEDLMVELDEQMWQLEQGHMNAITFLRNELFDVINQSFSQYQIEDNMYLREKNFEDFFNILSNRDPLLRMVTLKENVNTFQSFPPYWYELGCSYLDNYEINAKEEYLNNAWECFSKYEKINKDCPMFLTDERIGMIALYRLKYLNDLNKDSILTLIEDVKKNIGKDASALLFAALQYEVRLSSSDDAVNMIRQCLNRNIGGEDEFVLSAISLWDKIQSPEIKRMFIRTVANTPNLNLETYITFLYKVKNDNVCYDIYPLLINLQSAFKIIPYGKLNSITIDVDRNNLIFDSKEWTVTLIEKDFNLGVNKVYNSKLCFSKPDMFYSSVSDLKDEIMSDNKYFKKHPTEIEKNNLISKTILNGQEYYYLSAKSKWDEIKNKLEYMKYSNDSPKYDRPANIEEQYIKFYNKYAVDNIEYQFAFENDYQTIENVDEAHDFPKYTLRVSVSSLNENDADIVFLFTTDYLEKDQTEFYFSGIEYYNDEFIFF